MTSVRENPATHPGGAIDHSLESIRAVNGLAVAARPVVRRVGVRAAALRRSRAIHQEREARRRLREVESEAVLADYYQAAQAAEEVMVRAQARAAARTEQILAEAATVAAGSQAAASAALRRLRELGETRAGIRELTGLSSAQVREGLASPSVEDSADVQVEAVAAQRGDGDGQEDVDAAFARERVVAPSSALKPDVSEVVADPGGRPHTSGRSGGRRPRPTSRAHEPSGSSGAPIGVKPNTIPAASASADDPVQPSLF